MKDFFKRVLFSNVSEHASSTTVSANSSKFLTSDILNIFMTKLKDTFALKSQLTSLQMRVGQLEKTVSELESALEDAIYYKE
jgi:hypothetical protein